MSPGSGQSPADPIAEILRRITPDLLHDPRATGEGVAVAILDSGVERAFLENKYREQGKVLHPIEGGIFLPDRPEPLPYEGRQSSPHGTMVADLVLSTAPRVKLFSADVFGPMGTSELERVIRAISWAIHRWHCKIINISLGIPEARLERVQQRYQFLRAIEEAYYHDVFIFAAAHNDHPLVRSYPAQFSPAVFSVEQDRFADPLYFRYHLREQIEFQAHGEPISNLLAGELATSWATPRLAGIAARLLSLRPDLKPFEMKTLLFWIAQSQLSREHT